MNVRERIMCLINSKAGNAKRSPEEELLADALREIRRLDALVAASTQDLDFGAPAGSDLPKRVQALEQRIESLHRDIRRISARTHLPEVRAALGVSHAK